MPELPLSHPLVELRIQLIGGFSINIGDRQISAGQFRLRKSRNLVKLLALAPNHRLQRDQLFELLWPDQDPQTAANNLNQALYEARRILDPSGASGQRYLVLHETILSLCPDSPVWIDAEEFKTSANRAFRTQYIAAYQAALALYPGDLLPDDRYEDWASEVRETLHQDHLRLLIGLAKLLENHQQYNLAIETLKQALNADPANEEAHASLMRLYAATGQRQLALRQYQVLEETLQRELEAQPDPPITQLYQEILSGRYSPAQTPPELAPDHLGTQPGSGMPFPPTNNPPTQIHPARLVNLTGKHWVGRGREINEAKLLWQGAVSGQSQVLLISGEPGVGKTRFAQELAQAARHAGARVLVGECYAEGGAPYAPLAQVIRDTLENTPQAGLNLPDETLADLLPIIPSLRLHLPAILPGLNLDPRAEQQRVFEGFVAFCSALSSQGPLLLFIDDVHWADPDTLFLLKYLARRGRKLPLLIVMAYREAELESAPVLNEVLVDLNRQRLAIQLKLERLNRSETGDLLAAIFAEEITPDFLDAIFHQTEGNPFFIEEVCKGLVEAGQLSYQDGHWQRPAMTELTIPQTVRAAIQARLQKLPASTQEVLRMAAILGRNFDFETLKHACVFDDETLIDALEHAAHAQLITEIQPGQAGTLQFSFVHVLIPTTLRESVIHVRRRLLHLRAAQAIEMVHPDDFEMLAYQYTAAGEDERARQYLVRAGDRARPSAPAEAVCFYRAALELWPEKEQAGRAEILARLGYCLWVIDDIQGSLECYQTAYSLFDAAANRPQSGEMQRMIGRLYWHQADRVKAWQHYQQAFTILEQIPESLELARAISSISQMLMISYDNDQAIQWGERALKLAQTLGAEEVVVSVLNNIGSSRAQNGDFESGGSILRESLERSITAGLPQEACRAYFNLALVYQHQSHYEKARQLLEELYTYSIKSYSKFYADDAITRLSWINWTTGQWKTALKYRAEIVEPCDVILIISAKRIFAMIDLDLGQVDEALRELEDSLPAAVQANEYQTTVPHWGQLARAYAALGQEAKAAHAVHQMLEFISGLGYISNESTMSLLIACQWTAAHLSANSSETAHACLAHLERLDQRYHTGETGAVLAEGRGCVRLAEENAAGAAEDFRQAVSSWEMIGRPYDQARALNYLGRALTTLGDGPAAQAAYHQALVIVDLLSAQLDLHPARQTSFLASPLVSEIRQGAGESPQHLLH